MRLLNSYGHWHNRAQLLSRIGIVGDNTPGPIITYTQGHKTRGVDMYVKAFVAKIKANKQGEVRLGHPDYLCTNDLVELVNGIIKRGREIEL